LLESQILSEELAGAGETRANSNETQPRYCPAPIIPGGETPSDLLDYPKSHYWALSPIKTQHLSPIIPAFINTPAMLVSLLEGGASALQWDLSVTMVVVFLSSFVLTQTITSIQSYVARSQTGEAKSPPIVPFAIPGVGTLLSFGTKEFYTTMI
jgi:hypothetical protein